MIQNSRWELIEYKTCNLASYMLLHRCTIRAAADALFIPKSTAHMYLRSYLPKIDPQIYDEVCTLLNENIQIRAYRGGVARAEKAKKGQTETGS